MEVFHREWRKFGDSFVKMGRKIDEAREEFEVLSTTRRTALERPILKIETLRRERNLPLESFAEEEEKED
jgi:DNA anti-recombination protein RmuC